MSQNPIIPVPKISVNVRPATMDDLPFMDALQKLHTKQVGWMPTKQFEGKIKLGHVVIAESAEDSGLRTECADSELSPQSSALSPIPVGYCIGNDQYFKRDDVGIIYQMNVVPDRQRGFVGATLVKAMFDRAAYGCRLFCCWCAQDIEANYFWQSLGFVPLAFRAGGARKMRACPERASASRRVHIFWQRRIREGDVTTPFWFPSQTNSGSIREDRIVLPIPPGMHWKDAKPIILPERTEDSGLRTEGNATKALPGKKRNAQSSALSPQHSPTKLSLGAWGGLRCSAPGEVKSAKKPKAARVKVKNDPKLIAAARELRDRWLEKVNSGQYLPEATGKYEISRVPTAITQRAVALLPAA